MEHLTNNIEQPFWEIVAARIERLDQKISELEQKINTVPDNSQVILEVKSEVVLVKNIVNRILFPEKEIRILTASLHRGITLLSQPVMNRVEHHHHVPKIIIVTVILLLMLCLVSMAWYGASRKLNQFEENDTKYRFLKIQNDEPLQHLLFITDSLYKNESDMRGNIIHQEDSIFERFRRLKDIEVKESEIKNLKNELK